ncbi:unnamed protein product, partial [Urochloa humidicola]
HLTELDTGIGGAYEDLHPVILMFVGISSCGAMARPLRHIMSITSTLGDECMSGQDRRSPCCFDVLAMMTN